MGSILSAATIKPAPVTQAQMCSNLLPIIQNSPVYQKVGSFRYYPASEGEVIETWTNGTLETTNTAKAGDMVLVGPLGEKHLIGAQMFADRYEITEPYTEREMGYALAKGKIKAIKVTDENFETSFIATWDEEMFPTIGGWYACPEGKTEIYFIHEEAFEKTYRLA